MDLMQTPGKLQANLGQTPGGTGQRMNVQMMLWGSELTQQFGAAQLHECVVASTLDCQGTTPTQPSHKPMQKEAVLCNRTTSPIRRSHTFTWHSPPTTHLNAQQTENDCVSSQNAMLGPSKGFGQSRIQLLHSRVRHKVELSQRHWLKMLPRA